MKKEHIEKIEARIKYLKSVEIEYFNKSCEMNYPNFERAYYRTTSNEFCAPRMELEMLLDES